MHNLILFASILLLMGSAPKEATKKKPKGKQESPSGFVKLKHNAKLAKKIIQTAEDLRFVDKSRADVELKTIAPETKIDYQLMVFSSRGQKAYIEFLEPKEERGRKMLSRGKQYWSTFPDSKKIVPISKKDMIGNSAFAMADLFQIDTEKDYTPTLLGKETGGKVELLKLNLKSKHDETPYFRMEYWVEAKGYFPVKLKMFARSGKLLKTMEVLSRKEFEGKNRPETSKMVDNVKKGHTSWWKNETLKAVNVPDNVFTKEYLRRRQ